MDFMVALPTIVKAMAMGAVPILLAALGEVFSERAGLVNISLEGIITVDEIVAFAVSKVTGSLWMGLLAGMAAGVLINMIYAFCTVKLCSDQTVTSMAINILAPAVALFGYNLFVGANPANATGSQMPSLAIPGLSSIPVIGNGLFNQTLLAYLAFLLVPVVSFFFKRCRAGLSWRSVGENPQAAATMGLRVHGIKYCGVLICGALAGVGGAYLSLDQLDMFVRNMTAGRGYIAVAIAILGRYNPAQIVPCALLFGFCDAVQIYLQGEAFPPQIVQMLPYIVTLLVLAFGVKHIKPPAGVGKYDDE